jgi:hypothetical protein
MTGKSSIVIFFESSIVCDKLFFVFTILFRRVLMRFATTLAVAALFVVALAATPAFAASVLFEDNFNGSPSGGGDFAGRTSDSGHAYNVSSVGGVLSGSGQMLVSGGNGGDERGRIDATFQIPTQSSGNSLIVEMAAGSDEMHRSSLVVFETGNYEYFIPGFGGNPEGGNTDSYWRGSWLNTGEGTGDAALTNTTESEPGSGGTNISRVTITADATDVDFVYEISTDGGSNYSLMGGSAANATMSVLYTDMKGGLAGPEAPPAFDGIFMLARNGTARLNVDYLKVTSTPEPSGLFLITLGSLIVGCFRRRRRGPS